MPQSLGMLPAEHNDHSGLASAAMSATRSPHLRRISLVKRCAAKTTVRAGKAVGRYAGSPNRRGRKSWGIRGLPRSYLLVLCRPGARFGLLRHRREAVRPEQRRYEVGECRGMMPPEGTAAM